MLWRGVRRLMEDIGQRSMARDGRPVSPWRRRKIESKSLIAGEDNIQAVQDDGQ